MANNMKSLSADMIQQVIANIMISIYKKKVILLICFRVRLINLFTEDNFVEKKSLVSLKLLWYDIDIY